MADPVSAMAVVSIGTTIASGALGAMGASQSADAQAKAFNYKAGIAQLNSQIDKQNAAWSINSGAVKAVNSGLRSGQQIAQTKVTQAASGLDVNTGSNEAVRETQTDVAKFEQGIIRADAAHTAYGYETKAMTDTAESEMDIASAKNAKAAGNLQVLSSIIGTAGSVASKWTQANTLGMGSGGGKVGTFDPDNYGAAPTWSS